MSNQWPNLADPDYDRKVEAIQEQRVYNDKVYFWFGMICSAFFTCWLYCWAWGFLLNPNVECLCTRLEICECVEHPGHTELDCLCIPKRPTKQPLETRIRAYGWGCIIFSWWAAGYWYVKYYK